jgi:alkylation response protein AidB-like acyl-CoA dehydrogenase
MFNFATEEHGMIREAVQKVFAGLLAADTEKRQREHSRIDGAVVGRALADLGLFGVGVDDASMASAQVQTIAALEAGAAALPFPVAEALATHALVAHRGDGNVPSPGATRTVSGASCALQDLPALDGGSLSGVVRLVAFAQLADRVVIEARRGSEVVLVDVDLKAPNCVRQPRSTVEPDYPVADIRFEGTVATLLANGANHGVDQVAFLRDRMSLLAAAEIAGACRRMVSMTREYLLVRSQFGKVLGANQVLKHKLADNHVRVEAMTAAIDYAAAASDAGAGDAEASILAAKHFAGRAGKAVADSTLQMHGAIGYTMEFPLHLLMRRVFRLGASYESGGALADRLFELFKQAH